MKTANEEEAARLIYGATYKIKPDVLPWVILADTGRIYRVVAGSFNFDREPMPIYTLGNRPSRHKVTVYGTLAIEDFSKEDQEASFCLINKFGDSYITLPLMRFHVLEDMREILGYDLREGQYLFQCRLPVDFATHLFGSDCFSKILPKQERRF